ncbi:hypothetical protein [Erythrobacter crassostreae]|uniref:Uncharacterized protein n=1 Tax=Erythrobacter crassostreae TaxID=2828328 RepID=A0A9X1F349_9SPHN|nr:hypothetical protein [Erythrobacter crassostrea]MBV7257960.1 hypothetical protein [Erythrobacter crassostrea]
MRKQMLFLTTAIAVNLPAGAVAARHQHTASIQGSQACSTVQCRLSDQSTALLIMSKQHLASSSTLQARERLPRITREQMYEHRRLNKLVAEMFRKIRNLSVRRYNSTADIDVIKKQLSELRQSMSREITSELSQATQDTTSRSMARTLTDVRYWTNDKSTKLSEIESLLADPNTAADVKISAQLDLARTHEKLRLMEQLFPANAEVSTANAFSARLLANSGNFDDLLQQQNIERVAEIAETRLRPAAAKNQAVEKQLASALSSSRGIRREFSSVQVLKVHLESANWFLERNELTGRILRRNRLANFAIKAADGKCYAINAFFEQNHQGGGRYGTAYHSRAFLQDEMLCENV